MPGESKKISELESASSLNNGDLIELASVNALSETGYSSKKTTIEDVAGKVATLNPQAQADWTEADTTDPSYIQNKPTLATVATSGSYNDLSNKPDIPDAQVNSDWNSSSGVSEILNKPTLGTAASKNTGVANGVAELDANGLVPTSQLPSFVDDVLEYASQSAFPATGETGKIYVALDTNLTYRWGGSEYVEISPSLALGETPSTAYAGDKGKANADAISAIQTALSGLATVATTGDYEDLTNKPNIPTVNNATVTFTQGGTPKGSITLNQAADATIALDAGGSGSGGHTILDDEGTSLTQRNDLQFKGAYSVDNNTDQVTEVNVVREMTKAEFDLLTDDEKVGIINVTDTTSSGDNEFQPIIYSEDEREIGVWTDGKPLYQKSVDFGVLPNNTTKSVAHGISNLGVVVSCFGISSDNTLSLVLPYVNRSSDRVGIYVDNTNVNVITSSDVSAYINTTITIQYTKTTDTAGSGTWTPQGVPTVKYSTTEHIIGTWYDGSTLYEKTINVGTVTTSTSIAHGITNLDRIISYEGFGDYGGTSHSIMPYQGINPWYGFGMIAQDSTNITLSRSSSLSSNFENVYITIRYTKSTT